MVHRRLSPPDAQHRPHALSDALPHALPRTAAPVTRRHVAGAAAGICAALTLLAGGCGSLDGPAASDTGKPFDDAYVAQIKKGVTTKADIRKNIGEPWQTTTTAGNDSWTYHYSNAYGNAYARAASFGLYRVDPINKMLVISFSGDKVADYSYTK
jgi:SmpA / OmlA family